VIACPVHRPFMIHSDIRDHGLDARQWRLLRQALGAESGDAIVVVWAPEEDTDTAIRELFVRAQQALVGVPAETRQAFGDGTNGFERILPGPDRMYPDTDTPPLPVPDAMVVEIRERLPEPPWSRQSRYEALGLDSVAAWRLAAAPWAKLFDAVAPAAGTVARRLATCLEQRIPYHQRGGRLASLPEPTRVVPLVRATEAGEIRPEAMARIFDALVERRNAPVEEVLAAYRSRPHDLEELERSVQEVLAGATALAGRPRDVVMRWAMGVVMPRFLGRLDPALVMERVAATFQAGLSEVGT
jgi:glutamyl-tRNA(Gln) amidotransferase subunit E